jgi:hypothetical protein
MSTSDETPTVTNPNPHASNHTVDDATNVTTDELKRPVNPEQVILAIAEAYREKKEEEQQSQMIGTMLVVGIGLIIAMKIFS